MSDLWEFTGGAWKYVIGPQAEATGPTYPVAAPEASERRVHALMLPTGSTPRAISGCSADMAWTSPIPAPGL